MAKKRNLPLRISSPVWGYLTALENQGVRITQAFVFGSWAKGSAGTWSDIDLAVVSPQFNSWSAKNNLLAKAMRGDFAMVEAHGFHPKKFNPSKNPVVNEITAHGIKIM